MIRPLLEALNKTRYFGYVASRYYGVHPKHLVKREAWYAQHIRKDDVVLDVGCDSHFTHSRKISPLCREVHAFDVKANPQDVGNIHVIRHDATKPFPYREGMFDKVVFLDVIEHLDDADACMKEISRVLRPGGRLLIALPNSETPWKRLKRKHGMNYFSDSDHKREYTLEQARTAVEKHGFSVESIGPIVDDTPFAGLIDLSSILSLRLYKYLSDRKARKANMNNTIGFRMVAVK